MVKQLLSIIHREIHGLHEAAYLLGVFAVGSKVLAIVRDKLLAHYFGADVALDIYYTAFRIPDLIFVGIAGTVSLFVLIPFLIDRLAQSEAKGREFVDTVFSAFFFVIVGVSVVVFLFVPVLTDLLFDGVTEARYDRALLISMTRIMLLSPILLGISNIFASITQAYRRFFVYALSPILYNGGIIFGITVLYPVLGLPGLAWGVVLGALLHLIIQLPTVARLSLLPQLRLSVKIRDIVNVVQTSIPRTVALSLNQIVLLIMVSMATDMIPGSVSVFNFSLNLQDVPLSIIGVSYSVAAFPLLAELFRNGQKEVFLTRVYTAARHILFWSLPAIALFVVLRAQIVRTILGSGAFDWTDTRLTAAALALFIISVAANGLMLLLVRAYYAAGNTRRPVITSVLSSAVMIVCAYGGLWLFTHIPVVRYFIESLLRITDIPGTEVVMLPLAYSIGMFVNVGLLWASIKQDFGVPMRSFKTTLFQTFSSSVIIGAVAYIGLNIFDAVFDLGTLYGVFLQGLCAGVCGIAAGVAVLYFLDNEELHTFLISVRHRFWRTPVVAPEPEEI